MVCPLFAVQRANVHTCEKAPIIDGELTDACYKDCLVISNLLVLSSSQIEDNKDKIYITKDSENFYIGMEVFSKSLKAKIKDRDGNVWEDDAIELYFRPDITKEEYYVLIVNGNGALYDAAGMAAAWNSNAVCASKITDFGYTCEISIPLKDVGIENRNSIPPSVSDETATPQTLFRGTEIGFNIGREEIRDKEFYSWSNLGGNSFHTPSKFGFLTFDETIPIFRLESIEQKGKNIIIRGKAVGGKLLDYSLKRGEEILGGTSGNIVIINEEFEDSGLCEFDLKCEDKTVYCLDFSIMGRMKIKWAQLGDKLSVVVDTKDLTFGKNTKFILKIVKKYNPVGERVFFGEALRFDEPCEKTFNYNIKDLEKGKYILEAELWAPTIKITKLSEEIEIE